MIGCRLFHISSHRMEQVANAKRTMEESVQESKRQQLNLPRQPSFSCLLDNVLASIHEFQLELGSLTLIPETPQQALDILEPLIWSSARLDFGITLSYFGAVHKVSSFGIDSHLTVDNWERIPRDILQAVYFWSRARCVNSPSTPVPL